MHRSKLLWRCRRGTRELDVVLSGFVERRFDQLAVAEQSAFERLLEQQDPVIMDWILGRADPGDLLSIVDLIRADRGLGGR